MSLRRRTDYSGSSGWSGGPAGGRGWITASHLEVAEGCVPAGFAKVTGLQDRTLIPVVANRRADGGVGDVAESARLRRLI